MPYHCTVRGNNRRLLYSSKDDYDQFLFFAAHTKEKYPVELYAATLMSNHAHFVVRQLDDNPQTLSKYMGVLNQRYSLFRNEDRGGSGKLYEQAFFSKPIVDDTQLAVTLAYVDLNHTRAGVPPQSWKTKYTTYWNHVGADKTAFLPTLWTPSPWYLDLGRSDEDRMTRYAAW